MKHHDEIRDEVEKYIKHSRKYNMTGADYLEVLKLVMTYEVTMAGYFFNALNEDIVDDPYPVHPEGKTKRG